MIKEFEQRLVRVVVEVVDLIAPREQVGHRLRWRFVCDRRTDDVGHVSPVAFGGYAKLWVAVEATYRCQVDIAPKDGDTNVELLGKILQTMNKEFAFALVLMRCVMIV